MPPAYPLRPLCATELFKKPPILPEIPTFPPHSEACGVIRPHASRAVADNRFSKAPASRSRHPDVASSVQSQNPAFSQNARFPGLLSLLLFLLLPLCLLGVAKAETFTVSWASNSEPDISGYTVSLGTASGNYSITYDAGNTTQLVLPPLSPSTTYFCTVQAYNTYGLTSEPSKEVSFATSAASVAEISITNQSGAELGSGNAIIAFGSAVIGTSAMAQTITITNQGSAPLTNLGVSISGANSSDFSVSTPSGTTLAAGDSISLDIQFSPISIGSRAATLSIASNDADENPFVISLSGTGTSVPAPEIAVSKSDGTALEGGTSTLAFGSINLGSSSASQTLTITNSGSAGLSGLALTVDGGGAADFVVTQLSTTSVGAGSTTTFGITFKPTVAGTRSAVLHIASNDADENPFDIALTGISISLPEIAVTKADGTDLIDGVSKISFGSIYLGSSSSSFAFTVKNTGTAGLNGLALSIDGTGASDFTVSAIGNTSVGAGSSTTFNVTFKPTAAGSRSAVLHIANNDPDENPFDIEITGEGIAIPEISITKADGTELIDGSSSLAFGSVELGNSSASQSLVIRSIGTGTLAGLTVSIDGPGAADFSVTTFSSGSLNAGSNTNLIVTFRPKTTGTRTATLHITSNDADESPFDINLGGNGFAVPRIQVFTGDGNPISSGTPISLGTIDLGTASAAREIILLSTGTGNLSGITASINGAHAADFKVTPVVNSTLPPGADTSLWITFVPTASGFRTATLSIASNAPDTPSHLIHLSGTAAAHPVIRITNRAGADLTNDATALQFGPVNIGETSADLNFSILNQGTADLTNLGITTDGTHASDFVVTSPANSSLKPGESTKFSIRFLPVSSGTRNAQLRITSNDTNRGDISIPLIGTGVGQPELEVLLDGQSLAPTRISPIDFGSVLSGNAGETKTFTIRNSGTAVLDGIKLIRSGTASGDFEFAQPEVTSLKPGASTNVKVRFQASGKGRRDAMLTISGQDENVTTVRIPLSGVSLAVPRLEMKVAGGGSLSPTRAYISFPDRSNKTLVITNRGNATLTNLRIAASGIHVRDFDVAKLKNTSLAPGKSASIRIRFESGGKGNRWAALKVSSNDPDSPQFEISLIGKGSSSAKSARIRKADTTDLTETGTTSKPVISIVTIDGLRYRSITLPKINGRVHDPKLVEVSSDRVDWNSGRRFTIVVNENERFLKVRDKTPIPPGGKRHIRYQFKD